MWAKVNREIVDSYGNGDLVFFMRSGAAGIQNASVLMWAGDQNVDFSLSDGIPSVIPAALSMTVSGMGLTHWDIGLNMLVCGYTGIQFPAPVPSVIRTREVLVRSAEMAVFSPVMRTHIGNLPAMFAQYSDSDYLLDTFARLSKIHHCLSSYTRSMLKENSERGNAVIRPLFAIFEKDPVVWDLQYQYMFGSELLVAPVIQSFGDNGYGEQRVYLPKGNWTYFWEPSVMYRSQGEYYNVISNWGYPPVFYIEGTTWASLFTQCTF